MVYRRTEREMTAYRTSTSSSSEKASSFEFLAQPVARARGERRVTGLECVRMELGAAGRGGARSRPVPGSNL